jgi:hypothetical protein
MYTALKDDSIVFLKHKGVSFNQTKINKIHYLHVLEDKCMIKIEQRDLRIFRYVMSMINVNKMVLILFLINMYY